MPVHAFLDENKQRRLTVVVVVVNPEDLVHCRRSLNELVLPGQTRLHFTKERNSRRHQILNTIAQLPVIADVYRSPPSADHHLARPQVLDRVVADLAAANAQRLVIEQDDSVLAADKAVLYGAVRAHHITENFTYDHLRPQAEPMLWIPDAVAWCLARCGAWSADVQSMIRRVTDL